MATEWTMVRLDTATRKRLDAYRDLSARMGYEMPCASGGRWDGQSSYNDVIGHLLDLIDRHRARARKSRRERAARRKQPADNVGA